MILVTNDDGVESAGLKGLAAALETLDSVYVVAPDRERSAIGMAITLHRPLRAKQVEDRCYAVDGTPVDCVDLAIAQLLPESPKLVVSGINHGDNSKSWKSCLVAYPSYCLFHDFEFHVF